ncbi:uncharacterized protein zgc:113184 isoform X2 [Kryptolebias marmoratus]|uniref:uncharacterized protein zgc:113184 isoform X2 n=1 Tax=Kryptolebias marmoratus TaxID=37003 RepID=UPI0007F8FE6B|nr:uncharacterized protein zgc:113184 isoform X2 [Kryptolebias marmoratus]
MEEAYNELYQQFLRLRSLCLKQAALLHQLTTALQQQQGASAFNGEVSDLISIPLQRSHDIPSSLYEKPQPLRAGLPDPAEPCRVEHPSSTALLAEDMSKLGVDVPYHRKQNENTEKISSFKLTSDSSGYLGASFGKFKFEQNGSVEDRVQYTPRVGELLSQAGGALMSDVALHSHVCEFCQAVFPRDSTTKGEFLRHLCTHVT